MGKLSVGRTRGPIRAKKKPIRNMRSSRESNAETKAIVANEAVPEDSEVRTMNDDGYEYEEELPEEEKKKNRRFDDVEVYEYELPDDFEDEEIDEDNAFTEEDNLKFPGLKSSDDDEEDNQQDLGDNEDDDEINLDSDEEEDNADDDGANDDDSEVDEKEEDTEKREFKTNSVPEGENGDDEDSYEDDDEEDEDDEEYEANLGKLASEIAVEMAKNRPASRKSQKRSVVSETCPESEFNLNPNSVFQGQESDTLTVEDLLKSLSEKDTVGSGRLATLKKKIERQKKLGGPTSAPLPAVIKDRLERKAGYEKTKEDVSKWQPLVKQNRELPTLDLSTVAPGQRQLSVQSSAELAAKWQPENALEIQVASLLKESGVKNEGNAEEEEGLTMNKLTVAEVLARRDRLARLRSLLFRSELRSKRVKKIKSKTFRKLAAKSLRRKKSSDDPEQDKEDLIKREFLRAQERLTLRHKNSTRWAKRIMKKGLTKKGKIGAEGTREMITNQIHMHQELTRKVLKEGENSESDSEELNSEEDVEEAEGLDLGEKRDLTKGKQALIQEIEDSDGGDEEVKDRLLSLPFMTKAIERKKKQAQADAETILREIEQYEDDGSDAGDGKNEVDGGVPAGGRIKFIAGNGQIVENSSARQVDEFEADEFQNEDDSDDDEIGESDARANFRAKNTILASKNENDVCKEAPAFDMPETGLFAPNLISKAESAAPDQWTDLENTRVKELPVNHSRLFHVASVTPRLDSNKQSTPEVKIASVQSAPVDQAEAEIRTAKPVSKRQEKKNRKASKEEAKPEVNTEIDAGNDVDAEIGADFENLSQSQIVSAAFAGDDVESEFLEAKQQLVGEETGIASGSASRDTPQLPGWGQWADVALKRGPPQWLVKQKEAEEKKKKEAEKKRKDFGKNWLVVSEKVDKKAAKLFHSKVPFPFPSKDVFERSLRTPIGPEFNTDQAFRDLTRPAVLKKAGQIIEPISYLPSSFEEPARKGAGSGGSKKRKGSEEKGPKVKKSKSFKVGLV